MSGRHFFKRENSYRVLPFLLVSVYFLVPNLLDISVTGNGRQVIRNRDKFDLNQFEKRVWNEHIMTNDIVSKGHRLFMKEILQYKKSIGGNNCHLQRFLVYKCDVSIRCGGWADRQKGIVTSFLLSLLTNRTFIIDISTPCDLRQFLLSNHYNWSVCSHFLTTVPKNNVSDLHYDFHGSLEFLRQIQTFDFDKNWTTQVVVLRFRAFAFKEIRRHILAQTRLKWLRYITNEDVINLVLHTLFKPNKRMLNDIVKLYDNRIKGRHLVCSHIRIGKNPSIPLDNVRPRGSPNATIILDFLERYDDNRKHVIYIATDSDEIKTLAKTRLKSTIYINRAIVHIDWTGKLWRNATEVCEGFYTALLEQRILSMCDTLVLTHSGFGHMAAYMRGISENLFLFHRTAIKILKLNFTDISGVQKSDKHVKEHVPLA